MLDRTRQKFQNGYSTHQTVNRAADFGTEKFAPVMLCIQLLFDMHGRKVANHIKYLKLY